MHNNELLLYYQPKVCLSRGIIIGAEALVRWSNGAEGFVSPDTFLPLAERSGLLHDLTLKLLDQIVDASRVLRAGMPANSDALVGADTGVGATPQELSLSINVAPNDLASRTISNRIRELLADNIIRPDDLQIEITESAVMGNVDRVYDDLCRLKNMGIKILMDDFGTGYSSIDRLSQLPFDALKLDQGVVRRMGTSRQNLDVVRSAISMARELGMTSVAEGIESAAVYNFLIAHGCEEGQGFYIGRPMSLVDFQIFIAADHQFEGSQIGRVHQACLNLSRFRKMLIDAAYCARLGEGIMLDSVADPGLDANISESRLGSWYFGVGQELSDHLVFADIEQPLREVHASGRLFLKQLTSGISAQELDHSMADIDLQIGHLIGLLHRLERLLLTRRATCKNQ
ncbi:MAG: EAL domain-containing protein (putative c-di-GMP-specific phosphodiesterase class I) [Porticoccaceae bacterium]|jgi:EAL domain-containing protein (putative c-di-GMP-specific phosphodiesterase class I)